MTNGSMITRVKIVLLSISMTFVPLVKGQDRPNIVFILADDFGYMDMAAYAHRVTGVPTNQMYYETPNLDRLVAEGTSFSQAYANQLCSPTRASLLTGKYASRLGFTTATPPLATYYNQNLPIPEGYAPNDALYHGDKIEIEQRWINGTTNTALAAGTAYDFGKDEISIAEALEDYQSAFIGKWHVGGHGARGYQPADQGFMPLAWYDAGGSKYFDWQDVWNNKSKERFPNMPQPAWEVGDAGQPSGEQYLTDDLTKQALVYLENRAQKKDQPFLLYFSHFAIHSPYQAKKEHLAHFENKPTKGWNGHNEPVYASMIKSLDESVGKILDKLRETGLEENTLVIFMSDNGGIDRDVANNHIGTKNTPFVGGKACLTEGGIRVPLVFRWKGKIPDNQWRNVPVDCTDLFPTILDFAGYDLAKYYDELDIDGRSFKSLLDESKTNDETFSKTTHYWHYPFNVIYLNPFDGLPLTPHSAIREGDFKLIFDWYGRQYLFDIANDPYEENNLALTDQQRTDDLTRKLFTWLTENVDKRYWPRLNPDYQPQNEAREEEFVDLLETFNIH
ncbi:MAG: sulfatase [Cyclobacteriaceae bacterium]